MKTKEELLKIYSGYLPYELKGELQFDKSEDFEWQDWATDLSKFKKGSIWQLCGYAEPDLSIPMGEGEFCGWLWRNNTTYVNFHSGIKPILYSMDYLTKEIEHKGEKFIPIRKIYEIQGWEWEEDGSLEDEEMFFGIYGDFDLMPASHMMNLLEWHFNVFQLSDSEYIKKETLK